MDLRRWWARNGTTVQLVVGVAFGGAVVWAFSTVQLPVGLAIVLAIGLVILFFLATFMLGVRTRRRAGGGWIDALCDGVVECYRLVWAWVTHRGRSVWDDTSLGRNDEEHTPPGSVPGPTRMKRRLR